MMKQSLLLGFLLCLTQLPAADEQIDKADATGKGSDAISKLAIRVRVTKAVPEQENLRISWRRGGEGLGGTVTRGSFIPEGVGTDIPFGVWTKWLPLVDVAGRSRGWEFPSVTASGLTEATKLKPDRQVVNLTDLVVDFEFAEKGKVFHKFTETAPKGATVGFAIHGSSLTDRVTPEFIAELNGLSAHARLRRERLEKAFPEASPLPKLFGIIGHLGGYGEGPPGKHGGTGFGTRHCNPAILADECRTLQLLGVNGMVDSFHLADAAGFGKDLRHIFWGGPGSGDPMAFFQRSAKDVDNIEDCPFDPGIKPWVMERTLSAIEDHKAAGAKESWALWDDEMGVYAKEHIAHCSRCAEKFREYLKAQKCKPADFGKTEWKDVLPYNIWSAPPPVVIAPKPPKVDELDALVGTTKPAAPATPPAAATAPKPKKPTPPPAPEKATDALRYYYTARFMTHATSQVFPEAALKFKEAGIPLYAMQGPTPSWAGASLDWNEFYDGKANTAFVFETSNRDARAWQWESYLADIGRGIAARHDMPMGCLVKPHRGAPAQRMLSVVSRGVRAFEWYTFGPDYSKGDSFSQSPELLERVANAARFLGKAEEFLYEAKFAGQPEVAFVTPRSSEIWGRATSLGITAFENAKWVYLALMHAHIPLDIISEQQLAEGKLDRYKVIYIPGTNLRRDSAAAVSEWVRAGGTVWTDAIGLSRDEANQPAMAMNEMLGLTDRKVESWGSVAAYGATSFTPLTETDVPAHAVFTWEKAELKAGIGREALNNKSAEALAKFSDGKPAVTRNRFGKGEAIVVGIWSGLTYSAKVRRADFDMHADYDSSLRSLIAAPALTRSIYRPVIPDDPQVEAVMLAKDGKRSVALMNWSYKRDADAGSKPVHQAVEKLSVNLKGAGPLKSVRSINHGPLKLDNGSVVIPRMAEIDLLILE